MPIADLGEVVGLYNPPLSPRFKAECPRPRPSIPEDGIMQYREGGRVGDEPACCTETPGEAARVRRLLDSLAEN